MAVELCLSGKSTREVAQDLGVRTELITRWKREFAEYGKNSFAGNGKAVMTDEQAEIARLKQELREAEIEREILKNRNACRASASSPEKMANLPIYKG